MSSLMRKYHLFFNKRQLIKTITTFQRKSIQLNSEIKIVREFLFEISFVIDVGLGKILRVRVRIPS